MGIDNYITDPKNHKNAHVVTHNDIDNSNALVVATHPLKKYENTIKFFTSSIYGIDMNIELTVSLTENIHNGTDNAYWTASIIVGRKWTIASGDQNHTIGGSLSIRYDNGDQNDILQIARGSDFDLADYNNLIIWIYVDKDWAAGDSISIYGWSATGGTIIGNSINLENYFTWNVFDIWHKITIPLSDMALTGQTLDAIRIEITGEEGKSPKIYLDDIAFEGIEEETNAEKFIVEPELGTWLHCIDQTFVIADAYDATVTELADGTENTTGLALSYDQILGESALSSGLQYQRIQDGEITQTIIIKQISDVLQFPHTNIENFIYDGTNTFLTAYTKFTEPLILKSENSDKLQYTINDSLSGLLLLRASVGAKVEQKN